MHNAPRDLLVLANVLFAETMEAFEPVEAEPGHWILVAEQADRVIGIVPGDRVAVHAGTSWAEIEDGAVWSVELPDNSVDAHIKAYNDARRVEI